MKKFIPYEKLSKKEQRKINAAARVTWGGISPVTRRPESSRAYNRKKAQDWRKDRSCAFAMQRHCKIRTAPHTYVCGTHV